MDYTIYDRGISGYAPQGTDGSAGQDGYSIYYTPYTWSGDSSTILGRIRNNATLSNNENVSETINYQTNDMILFSDAVMAMITSVGSSPTMHKLGKFISKSKQTSTTPTSSAESTVSFTVTTGASAINDYNLSSLYNSTSNKSPLYHHRSLYERNAYGVTIKAASTPSTTLSAYSKIVINFYNGMTLCQPYTSWSDEIFVDNCYFYSYGQADNSALWDASIFSKSREFSTSQSTRTKTFMTSTSMPICDAYVSTTKSDGNGTTISYRIPITFQ